MSQRRMIRRVSGVVFAVCLAAAGSRLSLAQEPTLDELLDRTAAHIRTYVPRLANVVCEEVFVQRVRYPPSPRPLGPGSAPGQPVVIQTAPRDPPERRLRSDFLLVHFPPAGPDWWMAFRDVLEVDGTPLAGQPERIRDLFIEPTDDAVTRAVRIATEGLRHHMRGFAPSIVNPLSAITFLQDEYRPALRFTRGDLDRSKGPGVRTVRFDEPEIAIHRLADDRPVRLLSPLGGRGTIWIEEATGRVLEAELRLPGSGAATSTTTFRLDDRLGIDLPAEMRTSWPEGGLARNQVIGVATYGSCRRFGVQAETTLDIPAR